MAMNRAFIEEYASKKENQGTLETYMGMGETVEPGCGDMMRIYFDTHREIITSIGYTITETACIPVKACASAVTVLAKGKPVMEAYLITEREIAEVFGGLSEAYRHCALMAELTLKKAIRDYAGKKVG